MTFKSLPVGETFSFYPGTVSHLRVLHAWKIAPRTYGVALRDGTCTIQRITHWHTPVYQHGLTASVSVPE
jgi:hypothetical protein